MDIKTEHSEMHTKSNSTSDQGEETFKLSRKKFLQSKYALFTNQRQ